MGFKTLLISFVYIISISASAITISKHAKSKRKPSSNSVFISVFDSYLNCSDSLKAKKLNLFNNCVKEFVSSDLHKSLLYKFKEFLFLDNDVSTGFICDKDTYDFYRAKLNPPSYITCFEVTVDGKTSVGTAFYVKKNGKVYLDKLKY